MIVMFMFMLYVMLMPTTRVSPDARHARAGPRAALRKLSALLVVCSAGSPPEVVFRVGYPQGSPWK